MKKEYAEYNKFWNMEQYIPSDVVASIYRKYDATCIFDLNRSYFEEVLCELATVANDFE
jgi:hypothetical protein